MCLFGGFSAPTPSKFKTETLPLFFIKFFSVLIRLSFKVYFR